MKTEQITGRLSKVEPILGGVFRAAPLKVVPVMFDANDRPVAVRVKVVRRARRFLYETLTDLSTLRDLR